MKAIYQPVSFLQALGSSAAVLGLGVLLLLLFDPDIALFGKMGWLSIIYGAAAGAFGYGIVFVFTKLFLMEIHGMRELMEKLSSLFRNFSWPAILFISMMAGLSEELLLRALVQTWLVNFFNPTIGIVLASLLFGLMHFLSLTYVLVTFALGVAFGVAYYLSESLLFVMVAHAVYDVFAFAVLVKYPHSLGIRCS